MSFTTTWPQNFCNPCKYNRASRRPCAKCGKKVGHSRTKVCWECSRGPAPVLGAVPPIDIAWLSGLMEGEGYLGIVHGRGIIRVVMTDVDVIEHVKEVSGIGTVYQLPQRAEHHKTAYSWTVAREASIPGLLQAVAPLLGERRRERAGAILALQGHPLPAVRTLRPESEEAWNWVSGIIEGEGYFQPKPHTKRRGLLVGVDSTDKDVVERLAYLTGAGTLTTLQSRQAHWWKTQHRWAVARKAHVESVLSRILPSPAPGAPGRQRTYSSR
jgi:hypothetical protein